MEEKILNEKYIILDYTIYWEEYGNVPYREWFLWRDDCFNRLNEVKEEEGFKGYSIIFNGR